MGQDLSSFEIIGMIRTYISKTLVGMGALKGAPCQIQSIVDGTDDHTITFLWKDSNDASHTSELTIKDGAKGATGATGATGADGADGYSPTITVKTSTASTYILTITDADGSYDTPNLKGGGGGGGASTLSELEDVVLTALADEDILVYDSTNQTWVNAALASVAFSGDYSDLLNPPTLGTAAGADTTNSVTESSADVLTSGGAYTALASKADSATTLAGYGIADAYTKTETDSAITTEIQKLDASDSAVAGSYVTAVSEADGVISVTREAADASPTANSKKMVESGGVATALSAKVDSISVNGVAQTVTAGAVDLDVASNLITEAQWTEITALLV